MTKYDPSIIEPKWQKMWEESGIYEPDLENAPRPFYNLMMFPYPSAEGLHVGNMYAFTGADIYGRFKRMQGYDVFEPIGLDGFGIHSENYALKIGRHPMEVAKETEKNFYRQLHATGNGYAWKEKLESYDPNYYKWTQWIFVQMFKRGLAYRGKAPVNWCPSCKTVLADEQVINGACERCKTPVERKQMEQWFFKITSYAERLLKNLERINWSEKVKIAQRNWIGKKEGINIEYKIEGSSEKIVCFTTRPDTNFGATFVVIGPEHPSAYKVSTKEHLAEVKNYIEQSLAKSEEDRMAEGRKKTGVFTGAHVINNLNTKRLPVWISDFVLGNVGTGAVVGVPGHDLRDFQFAKEFGLHIIRVVVGKDGDTSAITQEDQVQEEEGTMINSEFLDGMDIHQATIKMMDYLEEKGWGKRVTSYHLRDWLISRQRYWGPPIPMINCPKCGWQPVPEEDLPVLLPKVEDWRPKGTGKSPLANIESFVKTTCPECKEPAERETDVSDTFLDSSWYFFRYPSTRSARSGQAPVDKKITKKWLPVDMYIGGAEHAVLHLLYSRFMTMVLNDLDLIEFDEPYKRFYANGLLIYEGAKMSKSKGNIVVPDAYINRYGADTLRCYLMFLGPFDQGGDFRDAGILGIWRFLNRIWNLAIGELKNKRTEEQKNIRINSDKNSDLIRIQHQTIKKVTKDIESLRYNTALSALMEYYNKLANGKWQMANGEMREHIETLLLLLAPFAPHITEELWLKMSIDIYADKRRSAQTSVSDQRKSAFASIHTHPWPQHDQSLINEEGVTIVVCVNGKMRDRLEVSRSQASEEKKLVKLATGSPKVKKYLAGQKIKKTVFVPEKMINFVV